MKSIIVGLFICLYSLSSWSQEDKSESSSITFGLEQDVLPYILKGYILTGWIGSNNFRTRFSYAKATNPKFILGEFTSSDVVNAFGISFEYFLKDNFEGLWVGPGIGYWTNNVLFDDGVGFQNESLIFSFGGGYNFRITGWLYASPWIALHSRISGNKTTVLFGNEYSPSTFTPEVSVKLGVKLPTK
ncbi:MAG: hypothetical protein HRT57_06550 [Crocinitomicaceae bacterium]|nr:hypothetical protein [Crocinitomicaceae bacterium]